ncbi:MAG TPA: hypothetical protein VFT29_00550 [Gemmatimonadaceae bacterium]|nr:hypothetical protein [Gemmatimonadaceae bacterium]
MPVRPLYVATVLALIVPATATAQDRFEYAASTGQYRVSSATKATQEAMGQKQDFESSNLQLLTVTVARASKDTTILTIVIDSISIVAPMGMVPPGMEKLKNSKITAKITPYGMPYSVVGPTDDSIPNATQITDDMSRFLPRIKTRLAAGAAWTDTITGKVKQGGLELDRRVVAKYTVVGDTTVNGEKSWKIARESATTSSGSGTAQGQAMSLEGTANGKATLVVSQKGVFLGSANSEQATAKITVAASGLEITVVTNTTASIEKLR